MPFTLKYTKLTCTSSNNSLSTNSKKYYLFYLELYGLTHHINPKAFHYDRFVIVSTFHSFIINSKKLSFVCIFCDFLRCLLLMILNDDLRSKEATKVNSKPLGDFME